MSGDIKRSSISDSLVLDDSDKGVVITGITDDAVVAKSGLQAGDEIVAATIHLDHLNKNEVLNILKVLEPYDNNMKVLTKKDLSASASMDSMGLDLKDPTEMLNGLGKSLDVSAETPGVSLKGLNGGGLHAPALTADLPNLSLKNPAANADAKFTVPSVGLVGPELKGDLDGSLTAPDVSISTPNLNTPKAQLDIDKPEVTKGNLKYKAPKFRMPHFNLPRINQPKANVEAELPSVSGNLDTPALSVSRPDVNLKSPDLNVNGPEVDLKGPDVNLGNTAADVSVPSGKFKLPHLKWKGGKLKGPDADLAAPGLNLSTPNLDGDLSLPTADVTLETPDIKAPDLEVHAPDVDIDTPGIVWPHQKWKKPKFKGPKVDLNADLGTPGTSLTTPKIDGDIDLPNAELNLPHADISGPHVDLKAPDIDDKFTWPHKKWKKPKFQGPKADFDVNTPDLDVSVPNPDGLDVSIPGVDVEAPDVDIEAHPHKIKFPTLKKPKFLFSGPKAKVPEVDLDGDATVPDVNLALPQASFDGPDVDLKAPALDADLKAPGLDVDAPLGKFKWPTVKKPKWSLSAPKVSGPDVDVDADISAADLNLSAPKIDCELGASDVNLDTPKVDLDGPKLDIDAEAPSGKFKWFTLKKPKFGTLKAPKADINADMSAPQVDLNGPDVDLSVPDVNLSAATIDGPDLRLPNADITGPDVQLSSPDLNLDPPEGKLKLPKIKLPKWPKADVSAPDVDVNGLDADLSVPDLNLSAPTIDGPDLSLPNADLKGPDVQLSSPDLNLDPPEGKVKLPKIKLPKWPKANANIKAPEIDASLDSPQIDLPDVDVKAPNVSLSPITIGGGLDAADLDMDLHTADIKVPKANVEVLDVDASAGKFKLPKLKQHFGLSSPKLKGPQLDMDGGLNTNLSAPKVDVGTAAPDLKMSVPKADLKGADLDLQLPTLDLSGPNLKGPGLDADLKMDTNLAAPKADIGLPDVNLSTPDLTGPHLDIDLPGIKSPSLQLPKADPQLPTLNLKAPHGDLTTPSLDLKTPDVRLQGPGGELKTPDLDVDSHLSDIKLPHFKLPKLNLSLPHKPEAPKLSIDTPSADASISAPTVDLSAPQIDGQVAGPSVDVEAPNLEADLEKRKMPHFKLPKLNFSGSKKAPEVNIGAPDADVSLPDVGVSAPGVSLNTPEVDINAEGDAEVKASPKSKLRWPFKWGQRSNSDTDDGGDSETEVSYADEEVPTFRFHKLPRNSIEGAGGIEDAFSLTKLDIEAKDYVVSRGIRLPVLNVASRPGEKVDIVERLRMAKEKAPSASSSPTDASAALKLVPPSVDAGVSSEAGDATLVRGGTFKVEKTEAPSDNDKLSLSLSNMLGLNIKDSGAD